MSRKKHFDLIEVFDGTPWQAGMVKSMLEDSGIQAFLKDEIMGTFNPWWTAGGGAGAVKVMISEHDQENAKSIIEEFEKSQK